MKVLEVTDTDLIGRAFNGYDLHLALRKNGIDANMAVIDKESNVSSVIRLSVDNFIRHEISYIERTCSISNVLFPYADLLMSLPEYIEADVVHFHFPYHKMFSLFDYDKMFDKRSVWTIHDPWITTGNCTHPLSCSQWQKRCYNCATLEDDYFPMFRDNVSFMWQVKKDCLGKINPHIVVGTKWMANKLSLSPITSHFDHISIIPFGVETSLVEFAQKKTANHEIAICFRAENGKLKGCSHLYDALRMLSKYIDVKLIVVGNGVLPDDVKAGFTYEEHGFIKDKNEMYSILQESDIFVMPSLAESFGMMAIEAMATGCVVVCFKGTTVAEIVDVPNCGLGAEYGSSTDLARIIHDLVFDFHNRKQRQKKSVKLVREKYKFNQYVERHLSLYKEIAYNR